MFATRRALGAARRDAANWQGEAMALQSALIDLLEAVDALPHRVEVPLSTQALTNARNGLPVEMFYTPLKWPAFQDAVNSARYAASMETPA